MLLKFLGKRENVVFNFNADNFNMEVVDTLIKKYRNEIKFSAGKEPYITYKVPENTDTIIIKKVKEFLGTIVEGK